MNKLKGISPKRIGKERTKREYDLRVLNLVNETEYESRMAIWNQLDFCNEAVSDIKSFIDHSFNKLKTDLNASRRELAIDYHEFALTATEEINYIKAHVADTTTQYCWYALITLMVAGTIAICM